MLIYINKLNTIKINTKVNDVHSYVAEAMYLAPHEIYLEQKGKRIKHVFDEDYPIYVRLCLFGGKGGFGSMLRAIGAQIEKTTNREACRDLSGRRLRDINEEKRLKAWLEKHGDREREAEERKKRKIEKLLAVPKHEFKDEEYEEARSKLTEKVCSSFEEGLKKSKDGESNLKRRNDSPPSASNKKKKTALWLDEAISSSEDNESDDDSDNKKYSKGRIEN